MRNQPKIFILAGEHSGDMYGGFLASSLKKKLPRVRLFGIGGERMTAAGITLISNIDRLAVVGLFEVLAHLKDICEVYTKTKKWLKKERPDLIILIDYPDFNFLIARAARKMGLEVVYYISPQVWAWRRGRVKKLARWIGRMIVIFPFERAIYEQAGIPVSFVGHPLVDLAVARLSKEEAQKQLDLPTGKRIVALMPGSRRSEIKSLLIPILEAAQLLAEGDDSLFFVIPVAGTLDIKQLERTVLQNWKAGSDKIKLAAGYSHEILNLAELAITASGTATLEAALFKVPMVIVYQVSLLTFLAAKLLVEVEHIGMVNILAGRRVVPELVQHDVTPEKIAFEGRRILNDPERYQMIERELSQIKEKLGKPGVLDRTAQVIVEHFEKQREEKR